jgi:hypothetical protein
MTTYSTTATRNVTLTYTHLESGTEFPVHYTPGERIPASIRVQLKDGRISTAVALLGK